MLVEEVPYDMNFEDGQQAEADKRLFVIFFKMAIQNGFKSETEGRPIFEDRDMIKILAPGTRDTFIAKASLHYQRRFPQQWARYKANEEQLMVGTPLSQVPWMTRSQVAEFAALNCHTVEQLVAMPDSETHKFMGFQQLKRRAQSFLEAAAGNAPIERMNKELEKRDEQIAQMQQQMTALMAQLSKTAAAAQPQATATAAVKPA